MRKVIVTNIVSVDGAFSGPGGDVMAMPFDEGFSEYNAERLREAGTLLLGRESYEGFLGYWPPVADDTGQPELEREISRLNGTIEKVVVSDTLTSDGTGAWRETTWIVPRAEAHAAVAGLRDGDGADVLVFGSHVLWNDLLTHGLVDELHLMIGPGLVGAGAVPAFEEQEQARFELLGTRTFPGSGLVLLRYAVPSGARTA